MQKCFSSGARKIAVFKTKTGPGHFWLFRKLETAVAIEVVGERLALINNTYKPPLKTHYGNCMQSEQPISKRHMHILKICAGIS